MKRLTIPTGISVPGKAYKAYDVTPVRVVEADYTDDFMLAKVYVYVENDQLMAKLYFDNDDTFTSMIIKVNMFFH